MIRGSQPTTERNIVEFDVTYLRSQLAPGEHFILYDTYHPLNCTVLEVIPNGELTILKCQMPPGLGWENQFADAVVDTEAKERPDSFSNPRLDSEMPTS